MTGCLIPGGVGHLDGHVTAASGGAPIEGATVMASDNLGHNFPAASDVSGYYTRTLLSGTYTVIASAYSYLPSTVSGLTITTDTVTTQDFSLVRAPSYVVSGTVTESGTGLPLSADISFYGAPITVSTDPATGFYQAELPQNSYNMHVRSSLHRPLQRDIVLDHSQTQDFALEPLPCVLLVDDDQDNPDVNSSYTDALIGLGVNYDVWDTSTSGDPSFNDLYGYRKLLWYTGGPSHDTFSAANETAVSTYLDGGGNFFLSSQEYLWENGLTPFGQNYLHILNYTNDVRETSVTGQNVFSGLGPYTLVYPFNNWADRVSPSSVAQLAFTSNQGDAGISYNGNVYKTVFLGYPFETISQAASRQAVMGRLLDFFGSCHQDGWMDGHVTDASTGNLLTGASVIAAPGALGAGAQAITDPSGYYTMTLPAGTYTVTASMDGFTTQSIGASVIADQVTTLDFAMQAVCGAVSNLDFTWQPVEPQKGEQVSFTATAGGTTPIDYQWQFGDTSTGAGVTVTHSYDQAGIYRVNLTASNACGTLDLSKQIAIQRKFFLPFLVR